MPPPAADQRVVFKLGQWLRYVDDLDGARAHLVEAEQAARDEGDESSLANILLNRMVVETWAGRWDEAEALAARMADAFAQQGVESEGVGPWRVYVDAHAGRFEAVQAAFELARPDEPIVTMIWNRCIGLAALAAGEGKRPTGTSPRRLPNSTASTSGSRRSGAWTATRSRRRSWSVRWTGPRP